ncbi:hypothetical protein LZ30DRAFT_596635 [Colletotrichum cereale]|nr:hypothetical protein LZ30DRAFT_596635 [Colletotrichum cereale]
MEWPSRESHFRSHDFEIFEYEEQPTTVVTLRLDDESELQVAADFPRQEGLETKTSFRMPSWCMK